jgi:hypothetical protein
MVRVGRCLAGVVTGENPSISGSHYYRAIIIGEEVR